MSVGPHSEKFNIVSNDHGHTQKCDFCILVCTTSLHNQFYRPTHSYDHWIRYMNLEIQFWSVKCTTVWYTKISSIFIPSHRAMQVITMNRLDENKPLQNDFKRTYSKRINAFTYSNFILYWLFYFWKIT